MQIKNTNNDELIFSNETQDIEITKSAALNLFNHNPLLKSQIAINNVDSIAVSAMHIEEILLQHQQVIAENSRSSIYRSFGGQYQAD